MENIQVVVEKIQKEILKGRIRGLFLRLLFDNFICFFLGFIFKKEKGFFWLIYDLFFLKGDFVNFWIFFEYIMVFY